MKRCRVFSQMPANLILGARSRAVLLQELFPQCAESIERLLHPLALVGSRVAAQAYLGMQIGGDIARFRQLNRRHLTKNKTPGFATDLVLKNPGPHSTGAHANAEARDL